MTARLALAAAALFQGLPAAGAQQALPGHSFVSPPEVNKLAADWFLAGTTIPTMSKLVLSPGVPNRVGMLWSRTPLLTNDFEVTIKFTAANDKDHTTKDSGFAFWYVEENVTEKLHPITVDHVHNQDNIISNSWDIALQASGFNLFGHRSIFSGLGVVFCDRPTADGKTEPVVSSIIGDGKKAYTLSSEFPATDAQKFNFRDGKEVTIVIRVQPSGAKVQVNGGETKEVTGIFRSGGYLGLSVFGGMKGAVDTKERSDFIEVTSVEVSNYDANAKGEEAAAVAPSPAPTNSGEKSLEMQEKLRESSSFKDHRAESDAIKELTNMVFKLVVETHPLQAEMTSAVSVLAKRIEGMEVTFKKLRDELDRSTGHSLSSEFDAIKKELTSLSDTASSETSDRHKQLVDLHADIQDVHTKAQAPNNIDHHLSKLKDANQRTLESLSTGHQNMFGVSVGAIIFVLVAGLSLYNKFRCWEKKHVL